MTDPKSPMRLDIQALRGLAVGLVLLYHAKVGGLQAGYLGVDIFFVISGFLITSLVARGIQHGNFSLRDFYVRRAKRLLPAAYATFFATAALAPWFLNRQELRDLGQQLLGALTFTGNIVLWQQSGYFEGAADLKPLLHVWSLSIEEQYYFALPALLLLLRPKRWLVSIALLAGASLLLCVAGSQYKPVATFYLLPTRAWEMLLGSLGAVWILAPSAPGHRFLGRWLRLLLIPALVCLLALPLLPFSAAHPGLNALLVCVATLIVILANSPHLGDAFPVKLLAKLGDISYSLYLVHWPIIAFLKNSWMGDSHEVPHELNWLALLLSMLCALLLYRFVEVPMRHVSAARPRQIVLTAVAASGCLALIIPIALRNAPAIDFETARLPNFGLSKDCEYSGTFDAKSGCATGAAPTILVWGDSYAMHLVPGLAQSWGTEGLVQATKSQCGPLLGLAPQVLAAHGERSDHDFQWALKCIEFNQSVLKYLEGAKSIHTVVLSSPFSQYFDVQRHAHVLARQGEYISVAVEPSAVNEGLQRTVDAIHKLGRRVAIVAPPPSTGFNIGDCLERETNGTVSIGATPGCAVSFAAYTEKRGSVLKLLHEMRTSGVPVIGFESALCDDLYCVTKMDGKMLYRDAGHLSIEGSKHLAVRMDLGQQIRDTAN